MRLLASSLVALLLLSASDPTHPPVASGAFHAPTGADTVVVRVRGSAIDSAFQSLASSRAVDDIARDLPTGAVARYQLVVLDRRVMGPPEFHAHWTDVVLVRAGSAVLRTGSALTRRVEKGDGEASGAGISGARERAVAAGDVLVIPAGLAHQWRPTGAAPFTYVVLKLHPAPMGGAASGARVP